MAREALAVEPGVEVRGTRRASRASPWRRSVARSLRVRVRARSIALKSTSIHEVTVAAVSSERFMCSPIERRMRDSATGGGGS